MPEEREGLVKLLINRPELFDRPIRKRALRATRQGASQTMKMKLSPIFANIVASAASQPISQSIKTFVQGAMKGK